MNTVPTMSLQELDEFRRRRVSPARFLSSVISAVDYDYPIRSSSWSWRWSSSFFPIVLWNLEVLCLALWFCNCYCVESLISLCLDVVLLHPFGVSLVACPTGLAMGVSEHHEQSCFEVSELARCRRSSQWCLACVCLCALLSFILCCMSNWTCAVFFLQLSCFTVLDDLLDVCQ